MRKRTDHYLGRLHLIVRVYRDDPQYGFILWGTRRGTPTLDIWFRRTLYTLRVVRCD